MKITKAEYMHERIVVWTDRFPNTGFNFEPDEITDKKDLLNKVKVRVQEMIDEETTEDTGLQKFNSVKNIEGSDI